MSIKPYEKMTKAELLKAISFFKLEGKVAELGKDENSLINADYVKVLNAFRDSQAAVNSADNIEDSADIANNEIDNGENDMSGKVENKEIEDNGEKTETKVIKTEVNKAPVVRVKAFKDMTRDEQIEFASEYNETKTMVIVTDHDTTQNFDADIQERGVKINWGNKRCGGDDCVFMHGEPQYVRNGALAAMRTMLIPTNSKNSTSRTKARFSITEVEGWTQEKIDELKAQQKLKGN